MVTCQQGMLFLDCDFDDWTSMKLLKTQHRNENIKDSPDDFHGGYLVAGLWELPAGCQELEVVICQDSEARLCSLESWQNGGQASFQAHHRLSLKVRQAVASWCWERGMRHASTALYFYRASKKNVQKPTANFWINLFKRKYVLTNCLQLLYLRFLS